MIAPQKPRNIYQLSSNKVAGFFFENNPLNLT